MKTAITLILLSLVISFSSIAQDLSFSQAFASPTILNPALTGIEEQPKLSFIHRNQWAFSKASFTSNAAGFENSLQEINSFYGVHFLNDIEGNKVIKNQSLNLFYAYQIKINQTWTFRTGIQIGLNHKSLNTDELVFEDQINDRQGIVRPSNELIQSNNIYYSDFSSGFSFLSKKYFMGFAIHHLNQPNVSFINESPRVINLRFTAHWGAKLNHRSNKRIKTYYSPNIIFKQQGASRNILIGNYFKYNCLTLGAWYNLNQAVVLTGGTEFKQFRLGYSVDISMKQFGGTFAHEVSIIYLLQKRSKNKRSRVDERISCPNF